MEEVKFLLVWQAFLAGSGYIMCMNYEEEAPSMVLNTTDFIIRARMLFPKSVPYASQMYLHRNTVCRLSVL